MASPGEKSAKDNQDGEADEGQQDAIRTQLYVYLHPIPTGALTWRSLPAPAASAIALRSWLLVVRQVGRFAAVLDVWLGGLAHRFAVVNYKLYEPLVLVSPGRDAAKTETGKKEEFVNVL